MRNIKELLDTAIRLDTNLSLKASYDALKNILLEGKSLEFKGFINNYDLSKFPLINQIFSNLLWSWKINTLMTKLEKIINDYII